ncbi:MAG TPA: thymidylate synthase [Pseudonocardiaceae bacterium]|jgi:thymidylate synthase
MAVVSDSRLDRSLHGAHFNSFHECYPAVLDAVFHRSEYASAPRGQLIREMIGASYSVARPWQRFFLSPARRTNLVFNYAEALWYLTGGDELDYLRYYAPTIANFTGPARRLSGSAYGPRIFANGVNSVDQWRRVSDLLTTDEGSRRAVIQIFSPTESLDLDNADVACTLSFQFLLRDGALELIAYMRANDAYRGMVSDVFSFTLLQEVLATQLGVATGRYHHHVGSLHVYERDRDRVTRVLTTPVHPDGELMFPSIPANTDVWHDLKIVSDWETGLRADTRRLSDHTPGSLELPPYWQDVVVLLDCYRRLRRGEPQREALVLRLPEVFRLALAFRWPDAFPMS